MIQRDLAAEIKRLAEGFPAIAITGPRQSGKTTLAKEVFPHYVYKTCEDPDVLSQALKDPRNFLNGFQTAPGVILDEIQNAPELFSYLQSYIDEYKRPGFYILTGSQNFLLLQSITQTLAGRIAMFTLLPLSTSELARAQLLPADPLQAIVNGWYPALYANKLRATDFYPNYIISYLEREVRSIKNVVDLSLFQAFLRLCVGRIGQLLNVVSLANDCGISVATANAWLSILEASYIIFFLSPHYKNFSKRLIKNPKLYFYDTGVACSLLGIKSANDVQGHYLRGGLFESMVIADLIKQQINCGDRPSCYFWRDKTGHEVDCLIERGQYLFPIEIKAGLTINESFFTGLNYWNKLADADPANSFIVYAGDQQTTWSNIHLTSWNACDQLVEFTRTHPKM